MAKGGSGDVLAGVIAAIYAREPYPEVAASVAVYIHGMAGDLAAMEMGEYSAIPSDTIRYLPQAFMKLT
jgi:NAD(P)H-hydrate epimerase